MKLALKLAYRNLMGAGLRTWLNVGVLSFAFIIILFYNAWVNGWKNQAIDDLIAWEYGQGQVRHADYDPLDVFSLNDAHGRLEGVEIGVPVLVQQATIYPDGRMMPILLKGIESNQHAVKIPTDAFTDDPAVLPAVIGKHMAQSAKLKQGDQFILRWRDKEGTFDATTVKIVAVFENTVYSTDGGQLWIPIERMWEMTGMNHDASYYLVGEGYEHQQVEGWVYYSQDELLSELRKVIRMEKTGGSVMYLLLLGIALLAIFDTQVLSVFRRQTEIGTYISLGMTRRQVVMIFTVEGGMNSIFASVLGAIYGTPLFIWVSRAGIRMPYDSSDVGVTIAETIYPIFSLPLIIITVLAVLVAATIVSYLPSRRIAKMDPVQALKGKVQ